MKLQLGEYVSLGKVEAELKTCPAVENICIYGDASKHYTVALVVPNQKHLEEMAETLGIRSASMEELCNNPEIEKAVLLELAEQAKKCKWTIIEGSELFVNNSLTFLHRQARKIRDTRSCEIVCGAMVARHGSGHRSIQTEEKSCPGALPARDKPNVRFVMLSEVIKRQNISRQMLNATNTMNKNEKTRNDSVIVAQ